MCFEIILGVIENELDQINMCSQCLLKFWTQRLNQLFLLASTYGLYVYPIHIRSLVSFHYLGLRNRMSYINLSKFMFSLCLKPNYIIHTSFTLSFPHLDLSPILLCSFTFSFSLLFFFFLWALNPIISHSSRSLIFIWV